MPDVSSDADVAIDIDVTCIHCGYNLRGLLPSGRCPECGSNIIDSVRGDLLKFADPAWLDKLRFGTSLKLWSILLAILSGVAAAALALFSSFSSLGQIIGLEAGAVGLWATFLITTQEPRLSLGEDPFTLRKVIRGCALAAFLGSILQQAVSQYGGPAIIGQVHVLVAGAGALLGLAGIVVMFGELVYFRRFARRIPDRRLARSTGVLIWAIPITSTFGVLLAFFAIFFWGAIVVPSKGVTLRGVMPPTVTLSAGTSVPPSTSPMTTFTVGGAGCIVGVASVFFFLWYISLLFRYRRAFMNAAAESRATAGAEASPSVRLGQ